jgi:hypothetical protein
MNLIKDIRLFESNETNEPGYGFPCYIGKLYTFDSTECQEVIDRLMFLLRHMGFSFGEFDHLYLNFTTQIPHGELLASNRIDRYHTWYRFVDAGCDVPTFNSWTLTQKNDFVISTIRRAIGLFTAVEGAKVVDDSFDAVLRYGAELAIPYKEKLGDPYTVRVLVKITDDLDFIPVVRVFNSDTLVSETVLPPYSRDPFILQFGTITVGKKAVRITPRKSYEAEYYELKPIKIEIK